MERKISNATLTFEKRNSQATISNIPPIKQTTSEIVTTTPIPHTPSNSSIVQSPASGRKSPSLSPSSSTISTPPIMRRTGSMQSSGSLSSSVGLNMAPPGKLERTPTTGSITPPARPARLPPTRVKTVSDILMSSPRVKKRDTLRLIPNYIFRENKVGTLEELENGKWSKKKIELRDGVLYKYRAADAELEFSAPLLGAEMKDYEPTKVENAFSINLLGATVQGKKVKSFTLIFRCSTPEDMQTWITVCLKSSFPASALQSQTNEDKSSILEYAAVLKNAEITASSWKDLAQKLKAHLDNKNWEKEWNVLEDREMKKVPASFSDATTDDNRLKNRYLNVLPLNSTRVKIANPLSDPLSTDYVNANFVKSGNRIYIASQAPLPNTFGDFFKMLLENNVQIIIMLTRWIENGKLKASNYIPEDQEEEDYSGIKVKVLSVEDSNIENVVLTLLQLTQGDQVRKVYHMHYVGWPDHGALDKGTLEILQKYVDEKIPDKKSIQVVHCSAGIGRTGTWIIAKYLQEDLLTHLKDGKKGMSVNMMHLLDFYRSQRSGTLTHSDQYLFLYNFLIDECLKADAALSSSSTTTTTTTTSPVKK